MGNESKEVTWICESEVNDFWRIPCWNNISNSFVPPWVRRKRNLRRILFKRCFVLLQSAQLNISGRDRVEGGQMDFSPQNFIGLNHVSEGGTCHGCSCKAFPVEGLEDEVPDLGWKDVAGCSPLCSVAI
mgnify:CR=1 FL=1